MGDTNQNGEASCGEIFAESFSKILDRIVIIIYTHNSRYKYIYIYVYIYLDLRRVAFFLPLRKNPVLEFRDSSCKPAAFFGFSTFHKILHDHTTEILYLQPLNNGPMWAQSQLQEL